jgi:hypothetical protein
VALDLLRHPKRRQLGGAELSRSTAFYSSLRRSLGRKGDRLERRSSPVGLVANFFHAADRGRSAHIAAPALNRSVKSYLQIKANAVQSHCADLPKHPSNAFRGWSFDGPTKTREASQGAGEISQGLGNVG